MEFVAHHTESRSGNPIAGVGKTDLGTDLDPEHATESENVPGVCVKRNTVTSARTESRRSR